MYNIQTATSKVLQYEFQFDPLVMMIQHATESSYKRRHHKNENTKTKEYIMSHS